MRNDMGRVVIERPRSGSSNPSLKARSVGRILLDQDGYDYDGPLRIPSTGVGQRKYNYSIGEKSFTDLLGPLEGYLTSCLGRKWDDVYSELSRNLGAFSWPLQHIMRFHVDVEVNTYLGVDGKVYAEGKHGNSCVSDEVTWFGHHDFYVHPITRVLCTPGVRKQSRRKVTRRDTDRIRLAGDRWMVFIKGLWFIGTYVKREFIGAVARGRRGVEYPEIEWPHYRVAYGKDDEVGTWLFRTIKSASRREVIDGKKGSRSREEKSRKAAAKGGHRR